MHATEKCEEQEASKFLSLKVKVIVTNFLPYVINDAVLWWNALLCPDYH